MEYFASIDQGTTSSRFIVFDQNGNVEDQHQIEFNQYFPSANSVEHDPEEIWNSVVKAINDVSSRFLVGPCPRGILNLKSTWQQKEEEINVQGKATWRGGGDAISCN